MKFLWGAATSAHQVEGDNRNNDWWEWEQARDDRPKSGKSADHYNRFRNDFAIAQELGHTAHRLSLEWSRLESKQGAWDKESVDHYRAVLTDLKKRGMATFVTLHHFTNPLWFARRGGWLNRDAAHWFARYAERAAQEFGDLVDFWITINEPNVLASHGYSRGSWPPGERGGIKTLKAVNRMIAAHHAAYRAVHRVRPDARVGIALSVVGYLPYRPGHFGDRAAAWVSDMVWNHAIASRVANVCDFWGLQYYFTMTRRFMLRPPFVVDGPSDVPTSDVGWPIRPEGLLAELRHFARYPIPIYITENGIADADDAKRAQYIREHVAVVRDAMREGIDVRGYLHWSLLDNFEWEKGFDPRFGLVEVDYETQERRVRPSARTYSTIMKEFFDTTSHTRPPSPK